MSQLWAKTHLFCTIGNAGDVRRNLLETGALIVKTLVWQIVSIELIEALKPK